MNENEENKSFTVLMPDKKFHTFRSLREIDLAIYEFLGYDFFKAYEHFTG